MSLKTYHKKRDFKQTPEPRGKQGGRAKSELKYVIQKHDASRLHYDFRLELDGVLKSWAVPKGPSLNPAKKSLAVQVEDHPLDYGDFEGVIPKGQYGGGTVLLWDEGTWEPLHDPHEGLASGKLHFVLHGQKLQGEWTLIQMHGRSGGEGKNWLLFKNKDEFASSRGDMLEQDQSVKTRRSMDSIASQRNDVWSSGAKKTASLNGAKKSALPAKISPQLAELSDRPPKGEGWLHEIKFDGYRLLGFIKNGEVHLLTRKGNDWTAKFQSIADGLTKLNIDSGIVDGEVVVLDEKGRSDFQALQGWLKNKVKAPLHYYMFDLLFCNGADLRQTPLIERKKELERIIKQSKLPPSIGYSDHLKGSGEEVLKKACEMGLEGIMSKRNDSKYVSHRDSNWLKSKCSRRQEFVIVGYTDPQGSRTGFGSLLLGYHDSKGHLTYAGRVGTGFDDPMLRDLHKKLEAIERRKSSLHDDPPARERREAHWVEPTLVGEIRFSGWTRDGSLRHPAFLGLRLDKSATEVVREKAVEPVSPSPGTPGEGRGGGSVVGRKNQIKNRKSQIANRKGPHPSPPPAYRRRGKERKHPKKTESTNVQLSHPDKLLYPDEKITKQDLADYYSAAAEWMLPRAVNRPLALVRCPNGLTSKCFFQRNWSETMPPAIGKYKVDTSRGGEFHVAIHDLAGLISLVQIGILEIHTWNCTGKDLDHPDQLVFDLDPGPGVSWRQIIDGARQVNRQLTNLKLPTFLKTSGGKGLHITVPIEPTITWEAAKAFCQTIVESLANQSKLFVANMRKDLRGGKIYLDYHRNDRAATAVAPYSTRARAGAPVSMPISWEELGKLKSADQFRVDTTARYLAKRKRDPWRDFERSRIDLHKTLARAAAA